jgi:hypothetical protein
MLRILFNSAIGRKEPLENPNLLSMLPNILCLPCKKVRKSKPKGKPLGEKPSFQGEANPVSGMGWFGSTMRLPLPFYRKNNQHTFPVASSHPWQETENAPQGLLPCLRYLSNNRPVGIDSENRHNTKKSNNTKHTNRIITIEQSVSNR